MTVPAKNEALHGNVPDECPVALLLIDVINDLEFPGGDQLIVHARTMAERLAALRERARDEGIPAIYVNDNFGRWRSDFRSQVRHCLEEGVRGGEIVRLLTPAAEDYFVLKPKHSGFYASPLELLLRYLQASTLILTGISGDSCVLFTAADAFLRDYHLYVPADCTASRDPEANERALAFMRAQLHADTRPSAELDLATLVRTSGSSPATA